MKTPIFALTLALFVLTTSCTQSAIPATAPTLGAVSQTTTATMAPTNTPDPVFLAQQAALLYSQDFESGTTDGLYDWAQGGWNIVVDDAGNHIYCNTQSSNWMNFHFGVDTWSNYAVEMKVKPIEIQAGSGISVDLRFDPYANVGFYGAMNLKDHSIDLAYSDPYQNLGHRDFTILNTWYTLRLEVYGDNLNYYIDNRRVLTSTTASQRLEGRAGFDVSPNTRICIDDIRVWALTPGGQIAQLPPRPNIPPRSLADRLASHKYPKLYYLNQDDDPTTDDLIKSSYYDILVYNPEVPLSEWAFMGPSGIIRTTNPNAVILTSLSVVEFFPWYDSVTGKDFISKFQPDWEMKDIHGKPFADFYYGNGHWSTLINLSTNVNTFIPDYLSSTVMKTGMFDGIFYDGVSEDWACFARPGCYDGPSGPIDINNDGKPDTTEELNAGMDQGLQKLLTETRRVFPSGSLITGNNGWCGYGLLLDKQAKSDTILENLLNGRHFEGFLYDHGNGIKWLPCMRDYYLTQQVSLEPKTPLLEAFCTGTDYNHLRFVLASALMFDGYFLCDNWAPFPSNGHPTPTNSALWYDEYSVDLSTGKAIKSLDAKGYLGMPTSDAYNVDNKSELLATLLINNDSSSEQLVWRRDFQNGIVLVNPSGNSMTVNLNGTYRKILGSIDPKFNDGSVVTKITLPPQSGIILLTMP